MKAASTTGQSYHRLVRRNRAVTVFRIVVPLVGALVLTGLLVQIYLASAGSRFGIDQITIMPDSVAIEAPEYVGALADGSTYRVWAETARATAERSDLIDLTQATLVINRIDGVQLVMDAASAQLDTTNQLTMVPGRTELADSTGTTGTLDDSIFDWHSQVLTARGPVVINYADGSTVRAQGLIYDAAQVVYTFEGSVVTLPETPGESGPEDEGAQTQ
jgi:lipopolysaccharide export system protein LptC